MSESWNNDERPLFNWEHFRNRLIDNGKEKKQGADLNMDWIDDYVKDVLQQAIPEHHVHVKEERKQVKYAQKKPEVVETHDCMFVLLTAPEDEVKRIMLSLNGNLLKINGLAGHQNPLLLKLPRVGRYEGAKAIYKDDRLEIQIPKDTDSAFQHIPIEYK